MDNGFYGFVMNEMTRSNDPIHINLYVHIPFCPSKCHFCCWVTDIPTGKLVHQEQIYDSYVAAVLRQIHSCLSPMKELLSKQVTVHNVYFGGGTPTLLSSENLASLWIALKSYFPRHDPNGTITIEGSPDTVSQEKFEGLKEAGFNRVSLGVQSFDDEVLRKMGRKARSEQTVNAIHSARAAGFENINIDLMLGLPFQTKKSWEDTVHRALDLKPDHISAYCYIPAQGTYTAREQLSLEHEITTQKQYTECYEWAHGILTSHGFDEYVFSLFAKDGKKCSMDEAYFGLTHQWLGFGAGAHSLFAGNVGMTPGVAQRFIDAPNRIDRLPISMSSDSVRVYLLQMLRNQSINTELIRKHLGLSFEEACSRAGDMEKRIGELRLSGDFIETETGFTWSNRRARAQANIFGALNSPAEHPKV